jgi:hypothetical protein
MNSINTRYTGSAYIAKSWNGSVRVQVNHELNSEQNHREAAIALVRKLNNNPLVEWEIIASAPAPNGDDWVFIIDAAYHRTQSKQGITIRFIQATARTRAYMKVYSWWNTAGTKVNYDNNYNDWESISGCAKHAALIELENINAACSKNGVVWMLGDYIETFEGNRVFSIITDRVTK